MDIIRKAGLAGVITLAGLLLTAGATADLLPERVGDAAPSTETVDGTANMDASSTNTVDGTANADSSSTNTVDGTANANSWSTTTVDGTANADAASTDTVDGTANRTGPVSGSMRIVPASTDTVDGTANVTIGNCWHFETAADGTTSVVDTPNNPGCSGSSN